MTRQLCGLLIVLLCNICIACDSKADAPNQQSADSVHAGTYPDARFDSAFSGVARAQSIEEAERKAKESNKPVLVMVLQEGCKGCELLAVEGIQDQGFRSFVRDEFVTYIPQHPQQMQIYQRFGNTGFPMFIVATPECEEVGRTTVVKLPKLQQELEALRAETNSHQPVTPE